MISWQTLLKESPVDWLLEESNPSVRYFTLRDILGKREDDPQVIAAKRAISRSKVVSKIFSKQNAEGYWEEPFNPYHPKYKSSYWQIMILAQLGMDKTDERVERACEYAFQFQLEDGGFSSYTLERAVEEHTLLLKKGKKLPPQGEFASSLVFEHQYSCLTGNMAAALIRIGYADDKRVKKALEWLVKIQNQDGGWLCPYWRAHIRDKHGCFDGTICPLEAFSEVYDNSFTIMDYAPTGDSEVTTLEFVEINSSVKLSQLYGVLGKVAKEIGKIYEKSEDQSLMSLALGYSQMNEEAKKLSKLVEKRLTAFNLQILSSSTLLKDMMCGPCGCQNDECGGTTPPPLPPAGGCGIACCLACQILCNAFIGGVCILVCIFTLGIGCAICEFLSTYPELAGLGCDVFCQYIGWC